MARIRHIAIFSDDPASLAEFYADVFGMKINGSSKDGAVWMTDGYMDIALLKRRSDLAPQGVHHFGITVDVEEKDEVFRRLRARNAEIMTPPPGRPYVEDAVKDADGNKFDISASAVTARDGQVELKDEARVRELEQA